jgi:hypothetical protein
MLVLRRNDKADLQNGEKHRCEVKGFRYSKATLEAMQ